MRMARARAAFPTARQNLYPLPPSMRRISTLLPIVTLMFCASFASAAASAAATAATTAATVSDADALARLRSFVGLLAFTFLAFLIGRIRGARTIPWRVILWGLALQFVFGLVVLKVPNLLEAVQYAVQRLLDFTREGAKMVFGDLANAGGAAVTSSGGLPIGYAANVGYFAFFVLPTIIFFSALTAIAYHSGIMQYV